MGLNRAVIFDRWRNQRHHTAIGNNRTVVFYTACIALIFKTVFEGEFALCNIAVG